MKQEEKLGLDEFNLDSTLTCVRCSFLELVYILYIFDYNHLYL